MTIRRWKQIYTRLQPPYLPARDSDALMLFDKLLPVAPSQVLIRRRLFWSNQPLTQPTDRYPQHDNSLSTNAR